MTKKAAGQVTIYTSAQKPETGEKKERVRTSLWRRNRTGGKKPQPVIVHTPGTVKNDKEERHDQVKARAYAVTQPKIVYADTQQNEPDGGKIVWNVVPKPKKRRAWIPGRVRAKNGRPSVGERLLRNTAVACALLLCVLALRNIDQPWAQTASGSVEKVLTMKIDLDETLGQLSFVKNLMPESALVFWNLTGEAGFTAPVTGNIRHNYSSEQPWVEFSCEPATDVYAVKDGTVTGLVKNDAGEYVMKVEHTDKTVSVYAFMEKVLVANDAPVTSGTVVGRTAATGDSHLYFEMRAADGSNVNLADVMKDR